MWVRGRCLLPTPWQPASRLTSQTGLVCCWAAPSKDWLQRRKMTREKPCCMTPPVTCDRTKEAERRGRWVTEAVTLWRHRVGVGPASPAVSWELPLWSDTLLTLCEIRGSRGEWDRCVTGTGAQVNQMWMLSTDSGGCKKSCTIQRYSWLNITSNKIGMFQHPYVEYRPSVIQSGDLFINLQISLWILVVAVLNSSLPCNAKLQGDKMTLVGMPQSRSHCL